MSKDGDMAAFGASEAACYKYPGADQQPLRAAFCEGAAWAAEEIEKLKQEVSSLRRQSVIASHMRRV